MDPYRTLGVDRGCTRDDVKAAFRAKVRLAHPDRGGDELAFINFCAAYKQILQDLPPGPSTQKPARPAGRTNAPKRPARAGQPGQGAAVAADQNQRFAAPPDSNWEADLVLSADVGRDGRPAPPPDPQWQAEFVLHDERPANSRPPHPADPNWQPDVVFLDTRPGLDSGTTAGERTSAPGQYRSLFERLAARSSGEDSLDWQSPWVRTIGILVFAALIAGNIWLCWIAWNEGPSSLSRSPAPRGGHAR
jgi:hypothetical protein